MHVEAKILKWGNSLGIRLSGALKEMNFTAGENVDIEIKDDGLFIKKNKNTAVFPYSENSLISAIDAEEHNTLLAIPQGDEWHE